MGISFSLLAVIALMAIAYSGTKFANLQFLFGVVIPYLAVITFIGGVIYRVIKWAYSPVPFRIPTTSGQQKSLSWIKQSRFENPSNTAGVIGRMLLEILLFRSLFRNLKLVVSEANPMELNNGERIIYKSDKWLWLAGLAFHWAFLVILIRHFRFFAGYVPSCVQLLESLDSWLQVGLPRFYITDMIILTAVTYLLIRRFVIPQVRYISFAADYFPLFLILGIAITGILMRYVIRVDVAGVKTLTLGLVGFNPSVPEGLGIIFYIHIFLVSILFVYFPFSKLVHSAGVFLSPTRNLSNNSRMERHINPWNYPVKIHTYTEYEDEFREKMKKAGIPVEKG
ncbi:MAG: sulfate reduction electron transfer complex DsrMKJOP subunit DsrM [Nitrospinae bacterium]|nr:sulfate reduction electron transfer complex DsrMKJOP subunit DsrM [Nitrospinota bacterium]